MAVYKSYEAVAKVQAYLEELKDAGEIGYAKSLKEADGSFDGKWGPDTDTAFWSWVEKLEPGSDLSMLVSEGVITAAELPVLDQAIKENNDIVAGKTPGGSGGTSPKTPGGEIPVTVATGTTKDKGWSTLTFVLIGVAVAGAGVAGWYWMKNRKPQMKAARSHAGLKGGGCGCGG